MARSFAHSATAAGSQDRAEIVALTAGGFGPRTAMLSALGYRALVENADAMEARNSLISA